MKIAMIGQKGIPSSEGGVERHVEEIATRLVKKGHEITVYCRSTYSEQAPPVYQGVDLSYIKTSKRKNFEAIIYTYRASIDTLYRNFDIIHYHALGPASLSFIPEIFRKKVVITVHGLDWQRDKWGRFAKLYLKVGEHVSARFPDKIIVVSENLRDYYLHKYVINSVDIVHIPNGVNVNTPKESNLIKTYGLASDNYILFLARLVPEKGAHYLIQAYNEMKTDKKLVIAGGSSHTDSYVKSLISDANNENIIFTGNVHGELLEELFSNAYVYVLPSDIEGMPLTLLEAMSYARCCLVSDIPENMEVIKRDCGFSFKKSNPDDLKAVLLYLLSNQAIVKGTGVKAYEKVMKLYNWDSVAEKTEKVYLDLLN